MKKFLIWTLAVVITLGAAYYQRKTGPTYPKRVTISVNGSPVQLKLTRSIGLDDRSEIKLQIKDTSVKAIAWYKRFKSDDEYQPAPFVYKNFPVHSFVMNKIFKMTSEDGLFADVPAQPAAGKLQYYIEITDSKSTQTLMKETPVVIRYKGSVPGYILGPHILIMFIAMLFSTAAGILALAKVPSYKKYGVWALGLLIAGGAVLGPIVQKIAFGDLWTGIPFGWDLTDNKTLIALIFWVVAVVTNRKKDIPLLTLLAAVILLLVYSIPHSVFGSELNYATGKVTQGLFLLFFLRIKKNS
jgi:hypothetical protein